ncbi:MAG: pseudouridine synthase [Acidobacteria bacterium]|nr:pseudouridine synthase [Acidobacteriota bacterium]
MLERLQKLIAEAGIAARRKAEQLIEAGAVTVNGVVVTELGTKADPESDHIRVDGRPINPLLRDREKIYVLLNKPRGYLSATRDPLNRPLAIDLLPKNIQKKVHTVGRLDFNTEGLLILTNDGALTDAVTRAGFVEKTYHAKVKGHPSDEQIERLRRGITIDRRRLAPADIRQLDLTDHDNVWYEVRLTQGRNQQVRKMFDATGHSVVKLRRVRIGAIDDSGLKVGVFRMLTPAEVRALMTGKPSPKTPAVRIGAGQNRERPRPGGRGKKDSAAAPKQRGTEAKSGSGASPRPRGKSGGSTAGRKSATTNRQGSPATRSGGRPSKPGGARRPVPRKTR